MKNSLFAYTCSCSSSLLCCIYSRERLLLFFLLACLQNKRWCACFHFLVLSPIVSLTQSFCVKNGSLIGGSLRGRGLSTIMRTMKRDIRSFCIFHYTCIS